MSFYGRQDTLEAGCALVAIAAECTALYSFPHPVCRSSRSLQNCRFLQTVSLDTLTILSRLMVLVVRNIVVHAGVTTERDTPRLCM